MLQTIGERLSFAPPEVAAALGRFRDAIAAAAGANLAGLVLYGGLARGRYRPGQSDVNVVVLLRDASAAALGAIAPALRDAWREVRLEPMILTPADMPSAAESFPTKLLDIRRRHVVLYGEDPFAGLTVSPRDVLRRVETEMRNLLLRLRRRYVMAHGDEWVVTRLLAEAAVTLRVSLATLLELTGRELPAEETTSAILEAGARAFDLDAATLARLNDLRRDAAGDGPVDVAATLDAAIAVAGRVAELATRLEVGA